MRKGPVNLGDLQAGEWDDLQETLDRFETAWDQATGSAATVDLKGFLPAAGDVLRCLTLSELIKADLEIRLRHGRQGLLEEYLEQFPELGTTHTLPAALIYEEYRARQRYGDKPALESYQTRFPEQYAELQRLVRERPVTPDRAPSPPAAGRADISRQEMAVVNDEILRVSGGYRLIERLNRGAFGDVWRAEAPGGVEVAIKIIFGSVAETQSQRELQALELIKRLRHPFLLAIHAYWQLEDRLLIAMELADASLRDRARERQRQGLGGLPIEDLLLYFREAAEALDFLHDKRVLHRDIKPENILVLAGHAKVADFDLARVVEQTRRLNTSSHCGTPAYTAPEVFWRGKVGAPSDQYSLAVTYAELRLNRPLFPSSSWFQLMHDHLQRTPDLVPLLEAEQRVLRRALAKDPAERFSSCREFMQALERTVPR
jgi:hypothetical protein